MRERARVHVVTVVISIFVACVPSVSRADEPSPDWYVLRVTAGPDGAQDVQVSGRAHLTGTGVGPVLLASGRGTTEQLPWLTSMLLSSFGGGATRVTTTSGGGSLDITVSEGSTVRANAGFIEGFQQLQPNETAGVTLFVTHATFDTVTFDEARVGSGSVTVAVDRGTGSQVLMAAEPKDQGVAGGAAGLAAGASTHTATTTTGIVGGFVFLDFCYVCVGTWHSPHGGGGNWNWVGTHGDGQGSGYLAFSGPAGDWSWDWNGVGIAERTCGGITPTAAYGAWAPVGEHWKLFRASRYGSGATRFCN